MSELILFRVWESHRSHHFFVRFSKTFGLLTKMIPQEWLVEAKFGKYFTASHFLPEVKSHRDLQVFISLPSLSSGCCDLTFGVAVATLVWHIPRLAAFGDSQLYSIGFLWKVFFDKGEKLINESMLTLLLVRIWHYTTVWHSYRWNTIRGGWENSREVYPLIHLKPLLRKFAKKVFGSVRLLVSCFPPPPHFYCVSWDVFHYCLLTSKTDSIRSPGQKGLSAKNVLAKCYLIKFQQENFFCQLLYSIVLPCFSLFFK